MRRLGLIANLTREGALAGLRLLADEAARCGLSLIADPAAAAALPGLEVCVPADFGTAGAEAVIALGGDGSLLAAAHTLASAGLDLPLIGLNVGRFGYLTAANEDGFGEVLDALAAGRCAIRSRTALAAVRVSPDGGEAPLHDALNDFVVSRNGGGHTLTLDLAMDGQPVARYACDGLIVATPTGSTAYSLSAGGPVLVAGTPALVLSVIAPHALTARPLVVPDTTQIRVRLAAADEATVYGDGLCEGPLLPGGELRITASPRRIRIVVPDGMTPYTALARKLGWGAAFTR